MPTIKLELENDIYTNLINYGVDIEMEFKKFLLQSKLPERNKIEEELSPTVNYWDALDAEIQTIKTLKSKIFN
jgi:exosome complex RNA-binding protein Rrp4